MFNSNTMPDQGKCQLNSVRPMTLMSWVLGFLSYLMPFLYIIVLVQFYYAARITVVWLFFFLYAKFCHETDGTAWLCRLKIFSLLNYLAQADWVMLHTQPMINGWLTFARAGHSMLSELHWNPLPQLHLYRSATGYCMLFVQPQYVLNTHSTG